VSVFSGVSDSATNSCHLWGPKVKTELLKLSVLPTERDSHTFDLQLLTYDDYENKFIE